MKVRYDEGLASRIALESCAYSREVIGEGLTEVRAGQPLSREMMNLITTSPSSLFWGIHSRKD